MSIASSTDGGSVVGGENKKTKIYRLKQAGNQEVGMSAERQ